MRTRSSFGLGRLRRVLGMLRGRRQARGEAVIQHNSMALIRKPSKNSHEIPQVHGQRSGNDYSLVQFTISA